MTTSIGGTTGITFPDASTQNTAAIGFGFKNRIINGAMMIDQRNAGASFAVTNTSPYTVDRFIAGMSGANGTAQRVSTSVSGFQYQVTLTGTSSTTTTWFGTRLESYNCTDLVGQSITVSFYAASSNQTTLAVGIFYANTVDGFGNGSTLTQISSQTINITSTMTKYSVTFTNLPSGAANGLYLQFVSGGGLGTGTMSFTGVQLEKGSTATSFDYRPYGTELALCQRYYQINGNGYVASGRNGAGCALGGSFPVEMRASPTVGYIAQVTILFAAIVQAQTTGVAVAGGSSTKGFYIDTMNLNSNTSAGACGIVIGNGFSFNAEL